MHELHFGGEHARTSHSQLDEWEYESTPASVLIQALKAHDCRRSELEIKARHLRKSHLKDSPIKQQLLIVKLLKNIFSLLRAALAVDFRGWKLI
jgi:hypothetical protein